MINLLILLYAEEQMLKRLKIKGNKVKKKKKTRPPCHFEFSKGCLFIILNHP